MTGLLSWQPCSARTKRVGRSTIAWANTVWRWLSLVAIAVGLGATPASAQSDLATVRLDGRAIFQVGSGMPGTSPAERVDTIEGRLNGLLRNIDAIGPAVARQTPSGWAVTVSGVPVVTVTARDAEDNVTTPKALATQWAESLDSALDRARQRRLGWEGRLSAETSASVEAAVGRLGEGAIRIIPRAVAAILVLVAFWLLARAVRWMLRLAFRRRVDDLTTASLFKQLSYYAILSVGFFVALDALGFDPGTVAAGVGLTGVVLGFALKDILSNFVCGLLLLILRPFEIGDQIVVGDLEGSVERIELRATRLRAYDGRVLLVPNAEVFTSRLINNTADPVRRGKVTVWIGYDADIAAAAGVAREAAGAADEVLDTPPPLVRVDDLGASDIALEVTFWTDSRRSDFKNTASAVRQRIIDSFRSHGIGLPTPDRFRLAPSGAWRQVAEAAGTTRAHPES